MKLKDKIKTDTLLNQIGMSSVNRMNAQIKLTEMWKALNVENCPLNVSKPIQDTNSRALRSITQNTLSLKGCTEQAKKTFLHDGKRVWNCAP